MARLIKTEKEVEGRYEDVWIVVEEDVVEQWPEGQLEIVGHDVPRVDGADRVRGQIPYTADVQLPGMLHTAVLRSPYAHARVASIDVEAARKAPGVRAVLGPSDLEQLTDEPGYVGYIVLGNRETGRALGVTLWASHAAREASDAKARNIRPIVERESGGTMESVEQYDVLF